MYHLGPRGSRRTTRTPTRERDWPIRNLTWDYPSTGPSAEPDAEDVLKEINGYDLDDGRARSTASRELKADGTTACGCWIYSGCFADGVNQTRRRDPGDLDAPGRLGLAEWGWAWPANRRILYNRASADPDGQARGRSARSYVWWDEEQGRLDGLRRARLPARQAAGLPARTRTPTGMDAISGDAPFIMMPDGRGALYSAERPARRAAARRTTSRSSRPCATSSTPSVGANPVGITWVRPENPLAEPDDAR